MLTVYVQSGHSHGKQGESGDKFHEKKVEEIHESRGKKIFKFSFVPWAS